MRRTYRVFGARAGLVALGAMLIVLGLPSTAAAHEDPRGVLLAPGAGYAGAQPSRQVMSLQRGLRRLGWRPGPVDGLFGPRTTNAVVGLQRAAGLAPDGIVGHQTTRALESALSGPLRRGAGYEQPDGSPRVRTLQARLRRLGLKPGPVDGVFGPRTQAAVKRLQRGGRISANGIVGPATQRLLAARKAALDKDRTGDQGGGGGNERAQTRSDSGRDLRIRKPVEPGGPGNTPDPASGVSHLLLALAVAALAVALVGLIAMLLRRTGSKVNGLSGPLARGLVAEGHSRDHSIGQFRGPVHAVALRRRGLARQPDTRYLVSDPDQPTRFWVEEDEVANLVAAPPEQSQAQEPTRAQAPPQAQPIAAVPEMPTTDGVRALAYVSVRETEEINAGLPQGQMAAIDSLCDRRGWRLVEIVHDREEPRGTALDRPGLGYALERVERGEASCLIVSELLRLSRSLADLGRILEAIDHHGGRLVALDVDVDTSTPEGRKAAEVLVTVSGWERQRLAERTRKGLEAARARGGGGSRPSVGDIPALNQRIVELRESGLTLQAIADRLNAEGVPTLRGGAKWRPSSVQAAAGYRRPRRRAGAVAGSANDESTNGGRAE